jgi:hypothetical protein
MTFGHFKKTLHLIKTGKIVKMIKLFHTKVQPEAQIRKSL